MYIYVGSEQVSASDTCSAEYVQLKESHFDSKTSRMIMTYLY